MLFIIKLLKNTLKEEKIKEVFILTWIKKQMMTKHEKCDDNISTNLYMIPIK